MIKRHAHGRPQDKLLSEEGHRIEGDGPPPGTSATADVAIRAHGKFTRLFDLDGNRIELWWHLDQ